MNQVIAKMQVSCIESKNFGSGSEHKTLHMQCAYDPNLPEDQRFTKFTPSGKLEMQIDNPPALAFFVPGKKYLLTFTEAE